jgi:hypothetical protein
MFPPLLVTGIALLFTFRRISISAAHFILGNRTRADGTLISDVTRNDF